MKSNIRSGRGLSVHLIPLLVTALIVFMMTSPVLGQEVSKDLLKEMLNALETNGPNHRAIRLAISDPTVFEYFELPYETDLQRRVFQKTDEYRTLADSLEKIKNEEKELWSNLQLFLLSNYLVDDSCFVIERYENSGPAELPPKALYGVDFPQLTYRKWPSEMLNIEGVHGTYMVLECTDTEALAIEQNKEDIDVFLFYKVAGKTKKTYSFYKIDFANLLPGNYGWRRYTADLLSSKDVHLVVVSKDRQKLYFARSYRKR